MKNQSLAFLTFLFASMPAVGMAQGAPQDAPPAATPAQPTLPAPIDETPPPLPPLSPRAEPPPAPVIVTMPAPASPVVVAPAAQVYPQADATIRPGVDARESMWRIEMGLRGSYVPSAGYDPFSANDFLPAFSVAASRTLAAGHHLSFAAGLSWDYGRSGAEDRGDHASISAQRIEVPLEGRVHLGPLGYIFVRAAPGVVAEHAEVDDASAAAPLTKTRWLFATDVSGGLAWLVTPRSSDPARARLWLQADGGYGWVASQRLDLAPALASGDARVVSGTDLGSISLSGGFFRIAAAVSF